MQPYDKERSREIRRRIRSVLLSEWDPIGVKDIPDAADEYDGYLGKIYELIDKGAPASDIEDYLRWAEVRNMGLSGVRTDVRRSVAASLKQIIPTTIP